MRSIKWAVLLGLLAGAAFAHSTCEEDVQEEIERERKEDADSHSCRACKSIEVEAAPNCPKMGYDCDESLQLTSTPLDSCDCAHLRCAAANATLAVDQELVKKVTCKDRKWITKTGEAESAVCVRQCGLKVCAPFPALTPEEELTLKPLDVQPPDAEHPCAWAECENGAYMEDDTAHSEQGPASFACTGSGTWKYIGTDGEKRNLKRAYCTKQACGLDVCPPLPPLEPGQETFFKPLAVQPPDADHPCAWAECEYGAAVVDETSSSIEQGAASFACTGSATWKYIGPGGEKLNLKAAFCLKEVKNSYSLLPKQGCKTLPFSDANDVCDGQYKCTPPTYDDLGGGMGTMQCPQFRELRLTATNSIVGSPRCTFGQWIANEPISKESQVMCIYCPDFNTESMDAVKPIDENGAVTCSSGKITIEISPGTGQRDVEVASMVCQLGAFTWFTAGGDWGADESLTKVIEQGIPWRVICKQ